MIPLIATLLGFVGFSTFKENETNNTSSPKNQTMETEKIKEEFNTLKQEITSVKENVAISLLNTGEQMLNIKKDVAILKGDFTYLKGQTAVNNSILLQHNNQIFDISTLNEEQQQNIEAQMLLNEQQQHQINNIESTVNTLQTELTAQKISFVQSTTTTEKLIKDLETLSKANNLNKQETDKIKNEVARLKKQYKAANDMLLKISLPNNEDEINQQIKDLKNMNESLQQQINSLQKEFFWIDAK